MITNLYFTNIGIWHRDSSVKFRKIQKSPTHFKDASFECHKLNKFALHVMEFKVRHVLCLSFFVPLYKTWFHKYFSNEYTLFRSILPYFF